jgi:hypothetical protein
MTLKKYSFQSLVSANPGLKFNPASVWFVYFYTTVYFETFIEENSY